MNTGYDQLLEATIYHLRNLKARGARLVSVSPETLRALSRPVPPAATPSRAANASSKPPPRANSVRRQESAGHLPVAPPTAIPAPVAERPSAAGSSAVASASKSAAMAALRDQALKCVKCPHLARSRRNVAFGVGDVEAQLMFVGEAPGMDEDAQGEPFVGRAGQLLTRIIQTMNLSRQTVYIANILKCRPDTPRQSTGNRKPTPEEMETCIPWLLEQIEIIQPKVMVALGATAVQGLLGKCPSITRMRGQWQSFRGIPLMPTFHPSFLLRPENADKKRLVWEDMLTVMEKLGMPISDKQRGFFRKPATG